MPSKRPHPQGPMDHLSPQAKKGEHDVPQETPGDDKKHQEQAHQMESNMARQQDGDRSKRQSAELDADSSRGEPPHGYGTEAPQVQGGGKR
jgi:hypothetical protein